MSKARVFVPLIKVDEEQRLVYGTATAELPDKAGEVMDYATSKPNFEKWSGDIEKATDGKSLGNVRAMHGKVAAGKLTDITFNDEAQAIDVCAKVVDDAEWQKVLEGVYTGFSIGGSYAKKWNETIDGKTVKKYTAVPSEISLVDNPCLSAATFTMVKADGAEEQVAFQVYEPTNVEITNKATELAKDAGSGNWTDFIEEAREALKLEKAAASDESESDEDTTDESTQEPAEAGEGGEEGNGVEKTTEADAAATVVQVWQAPDGKTFAKKADALAHASGVGSLVADLNKALATPAGEAAAEVNVEEIRAGLTVLEDFDRLGKAFEAIFDESTVLQKSMWEVKSFASALYDLSSVHYYVKYCSKDDSNIPTEVRNAIDSLGKTFLTFAQEQVAHLVAGLDGDCAKFAAGDDADQLAKDVAALIDSVTGSEVLAKAHEARTEALAKVAEPEAPAEMLEKMATLESANETLQKAIGEAIPAIEDLKKRLKDLEDQPMPQVPATGQVMEKNGTTADPTPPTLDDLLKRYTPNQLAEAAIRLSQASGGQPLIQRG